jgi:hypothetical protein
VETLVLLPADYPALPAAEELSQGRGIPHAPELGGGDGPGGAGGPPGGAFRPRRHLGGRRGLCAQGVAEGPQAEVRPPGQSPPLDGGPLRGSPWSPSARRGDANAAGAAGCRSAPSSSRREASAR